MLGARVTAARRVADDIDDTIRAIRESEGSLIVTTGGTGSSPADHVRPALDALGASVLLDGVAMRPGGPTTLARLPDGRLILCLPGNPLAAMVAMVTLGEPVIAGLSGRPPRPAREVSGIDVAGRAGSTRLMPYRLVNHRIALVPWQGAGTTRGLAEASGLLVVPDGGTTQGARVEVMDLPWFASSPPSS
jgi:molybdopterin molybdotransferase